MPQRRTPFFFRELDLIRVKGKLQPVTIYELVARVAEMQQAGTLAEVQEHVRQFDEARTLYRRRRWADALSAFQAILDRRNNDGPSILYLKRCQEYLAEEPLPNWDGVFTMTHK